MEQALGVVSIQKKGAWVDSVTVKQSSPMAFTHNPLSMSLSSQDVSSWARESERQRVAEERRRKEGSGGDGKGNGNGHNAPRFKTPYLTVTDLKKPALGWRSFFASDFFWKSYAMPRSLQEAQLRLDGNVFEFFGNYLTIAFIILCCVLYNKPKAFIGGYLLYKLWGWVRSFGDDENSFSYKIRNLAATLISWLVGIYCKVTLAASYAILVTFTFAITHGCLRKRDAPGPDFGRSPRKSQSALGKLRLRE